MQAVEALTPVIGTVAACRALGVPRATCYRQRQAPPRRLPRPRPTPPRALDPTERQAVLGILHSARFVDQAPPEVYATLLDEGRYVCSIRSMYRILAAAAEVRERRRQCRHPVAPVPRLVATAPNQVWTWDITKLPGPLPGIWYFLYVLLDLYSRYVTGWLLAPRETAALAERLIAESCRAQGIAPGQLGLHADRGAPMTAKSMVQFLIDLGVTRSHSRPRVSNDNPYSEAQFKTLKYRPTFPERFGSLADARAHCRDFFRWYNHQHHHAGIALMTPADVYFGRQATVCATRQQVLQAAWDRHPERFVRGRPTPPTVPAAVWINRPPANPDVIGPCGGPGGY